MKEIMLSIPITIDLGDTVEYDRDIFMYIKSKEETYDFVKEHMTINHVIEFLRELDKENTNLFDKLYRVEE